VKTQGQLESSYHLTLPCPGGQLNSKLHTSSQQHTATAQVPDLTGPGRMRAMCLPPCSQACSLMRPFQAFVGPAWSRYPAQLRLSATCFHAHSAMRCHTRKQRERDRRDGASPACSAHHAHSVSAAVAAATSAAATAPAPPMATAPLDVPLVPVALAPLAEGGSVVPDDDAGGGGERLVMPAPPANSARYYDAHAN
jgi:hypothetical protein